MTFGGRKRKCAVCRQPFDKKRAMQKVPDDHIDCAIELGRKETEKQCRQEARKQAKERLESKRLDREAKERLKTRTEHLKEAQVIFNRYIRERDAKEACISCGATNRESWDAGHYRSVGAAPQLRFHEDNCHKQCIPCNQFRSGNAIEFRRGLMERIGEERVVRLETNNAVKKFELTEIKEIKAHYRAKLKELKSNVAV